MFSLPAKPLQSYAKMVPIEPSKVYLTYNASALLPALESVLGSKYKLEIVDKYIKLLKVYDGYQEEYHHMMRHVNCVPHYTVLWPRGLVWR